LPIAKRRKNFSGFNLKYQNKEMFKLKLQKDLNT
jgi:hypothetical protein